MYDNLLVETFAVGDNVFSVSVPDGLAAWQAIAPRYRKFAAAPGAEPTLAISVSVAPASAPVGENIYQPPFGGLGFFTSSAWRLPDGRISMAFRHIDEPLPRLQMAMSDDMHRAEIVFSPAGDNCDSYFLTHALMLAYMIANAPSGTLLIHSSTVVLDGRAYLFQGKSGTGKSTHASLWVKNVPGARLLNDDHPVIRFAPDGTAIAYGSPWSGKTHCYRNQSAPIAAIVRIVRDTRNELRPLTPFMAFASLTSSVFRLPFLSESLRLVRHAAIERLAASVPCGEMHCLPEADAAITCHRQLHQPVGTRLIASAP